MPTDLPARRPVLPPEPSRTDTLVVVVGVLMMLVVGAAMLLHPAEVEAQVVRSQAV